MTRSIQSITFLFIAALFLVGYSFMSAQWTPASGTPPANNTEAPINISSTTQSKSGNLAANIFAATTEMRSNRYCDELGANCFDPLDVDGGTAGDGIGYGQSWQVVNRSQGVWYQNQTGQPTMIFHKNIWDGTIVDVGVATTTYVTMNYQDYDSDLDNGSTIIIPAGHYYRFGTPTGNSANTHYVVRELRAI
jgi:hypothetical protein